MSIHYESVREYLSLLDWDLRRDDINGYFYVLNTDEANRCILSLSLIHISSAAQNDRFGTQIAFLYKNIIQFSRKNYNDEIRFPRIAPLSADVYKRQHLRLYPPVNRNS